MKFHWFNLMPWPYLPDDFAQKHRSVWVDVDSRLFDPVKANRVYNDYLDLLEFADELGFDGIGVNEHHQNAYGLMPSPQLMAATLARRTRCTQRLGSDARTLQYRRRTGWMGHVRAPLGTPARAPPDWWPHR